MITDTSIELKMRYKTLQSQMELKEEILRTLSEKMGNMNN